MRELKIKQLSKSGEIIGVVSCFSAKINVLRAKTEDEILPYQRALTNTFGPDVFELEVDGIGVDFNTDVVKIGFSKPDNLEITLREYLLNFSSGSSDEALKSVSRYLELSKDLDSNLSELSDSKLKLVEMLKLSLCKAKIFVMHVPFERIDFSSREPLANYMLEVSETQDHIIVVTSLHYTPKDWVQNEMINRIEVGQNRHKTIGFGSTPSELQAMLEEVRKDKQLGTGDEKDASILDDLSAPANSKRRSSLFIPLVFLIVCAVSYYFTSDYLFKDEVKIATNDTQELVRDEIEEVKQAVQAKPVYALNLLPASIKKSIVSTFNGTSESVSYREVKKKVKEAPKKVKKESAGESLLQSLQRTSNTGKNIKSPTRRSPVYNRGTSKISTMSEERRELLRQKFKEALARAASRR